MENIKIIAFDADDTLWVNETYFLETEEQFCELLKDYLPAKEVSKELFKTEIENIEIYGYGVKAYILSMIETLTRITKNDASLDLVNKVIELGKDLSKKPVELIDGVEEVLKALYKAFNTSSTPSINSTGFFDKSLPNSITLFTKSRLASFLVILVKVSIIERI